MSGRRFPDRVSITVGGDEYYGWTGVKITRGIERFPSTFVLEATARYPAARAGATIEPLSQCVIKVDGVPVLTGRVDAVELAMGQGGGTVSIQGRGRGHNLIDCSLILPGETQQLSALSYRALVEALCRPYGITVLAPDGDGPAIPVFDTSLGDTPWLYIDEGAKFAGKIVTDNPAGNLVIQDAAKRRHSSGFKEGANVESARVVFDATQRFSHYLPVYTAQDSLAGSGIPNSVIEPVIDTSIRNDPNYEYRPKFIISGEFVRDQPLALLRARYEMQRRYGRSHALTLTCDSWRDSEGVLWEPNRLASIDFPSLRLSQRDWVIMEVTYSISKEGTQAMVMLMPKEAISIQPTTFGSAFQGDVAGALEDGSGPSAPAPTSPRTQTP